MNLDTTAVTLYQNFRLLKCRYAPHLLLKTPRIPSRNARFCLSRTIDMGNLVADNILTWEETLDYTKHIKFHGINQFRYLWDRESKRAPDPPLWGDELEYMIVSLNKPSKTASLVLCQDRLLRDLHEAGPKTTDSPIFVVEFMNYMIESMPGIPYSAFCTSLLKVENDMRLRRETIRAHLRAGEVPLTLSAFPRLGAQKCGDPVVHPEENGIESLFLNADIRGTHGRHKALNANIPKRRGAKPVVNVPIYFDEKTPRPFLDPAISWDDLFSSKLKPQNTGPLPDHIYMDTCLFGLGGCCLQVTLQLHDAQEARRIHDALLPLTAILMALSACTPAWRGYLSDYDCRFFTASGSMDDRTSREHNIIRNSRWGVGPMYFSENTMNKVDYNDLPIPYNQNAYDRLHAYGIDDLMSKHIASLFIRDPLLAYRSTLELDDTQSTHLFENINSSVWPTLRFKPPSYGSSPGWRVEFRTIEASITDFESAAYSIFLVLLSRAILHFNMNLYIPMSKVEENMFIAHTRDAARFSRFYFRQQILEPLGNINAASKSVGLSDGHQDSVKEEYGLMTMNEIFNGKVDIGYLGLVPIVHNYLDSLEIEDEERSQLNIYMDFITQKSNGTLQTTATWMRNFIRSHPAYKMDSVVTEEINYDLMVAVDQIEKGLLSVPELLPKNYRKCPLSA